MADIDVQILAAYETAIRKHERLIVGHEQAKESGSKEIFEIDRALRAAEPVLNEARQIILDLIGIEDGAKQ